MAREPLAHLRLTEGCPLQPFRKISLRLFVGDVPIGLPGDQCAIQRPINLGVREFETSQIRVRKQVMVFALWQIGTADRAAIGEVQATLMQG